MVDTRTVDFFFVVKERVVIVKVQLAKATPRFHEAEVNSHHPSKGCAQR